MRFFDMPFVEPIKKRRLPRRFPIYLFIALVALLLIVFIVVKTTRPNLPFHLSDYEKALRKSDDTRVYEIYNETRLRRSELSSRSYSKRIRSLLKEADALTERIESDIKQRSEALLARAFHGEILSNEDLIRIELDAAIAGGAMTNYIEDRTQLYLFGEIEENVYLSFMGQIARVPIFSQEYSQVLEKTESLRQVRENLESANNAARENAHYSEAESLRKLLRTPEAKDIEHVLKYLEERMAKARQSYYSAQIPKIRTDVEQYRTYDALLKIRKMDGWFPEDVELRRLEEICLEKTPAEIRYWNGPVEHIAIKPLIADHKRAFDGDRFAASADRDLLLITEFQLILESLYERDYVLVDGRSFVSDEGSARVVPCPEGKKPLCLVLDDFFSSEARVESGIAARLDLDKEGKIVGVVRDRDGMERTDRLFSAIGVVEDFIDSHPDFSFNGATGTISVVAMNGLFGYPLTEEQDRHWRDDASAYGFETLREVETDFELNRAKVKALLLMLASRNWRIANGSYSRLAMDRASLQSIADDIAKVEASVVPITGKMNILHHPFGIHVEFDKEKTALLAESGYSVLSGYGTSIYSKQAKGYIYVSKTLLSGRALRNPRDSGVKRFFNAGDVIDRVNRP